MTFDKFILKKQYLKVRGLGDRLELMKDQIEWSRFIPLVKKIFFDNKIDGGRPHTDEVLIIKCMLLQSWYNLSDQELEFQIHDRISFRNFLDFPNKIPDFTTIWKIRERLHIKKVDLEIWSELQNQLNNKGYKIKKGVIQDATFIEADLGKKRYHNEKKAKKNGETIKYTKKQIRHQDKDATFSIKNNQVHYGYKLHSKVDLENQFIREIEVTTASIHDNNVDLANENEVNYRDRGYSGSKTKAKGNATMKLGKLSIKNKMRNQRISKKRVVGERPFALIKNVFKCNKTKVKKIERVKIKTMFQCFAFNIYNLVTVRKKEIALAI
jgi:IS5 family transposase